METVLFSGDIYRDEAAMEARVVTYAVRTYRDQVAPELLERWAREAVAEVWGDGPSVTKFVPMLALRQVREQVRNYAGKHASSHHAADAPGHWALTATSHQSIHEQFARFRTEPSKPVAPPVHQMPIREVKKPHQQRVRERSA